jgi:hypothetical protein
MDRRKKAFAAIAAAISGASLILQLVLIILQQGLAKGLWLYFGYFTILTNILVFVMALGVASGRASAPLAGAKARLAVTAAILMVGAAYWALLAAHWQPQGWQLVADIGLHTASPLVAAAAWFAARDGMLQWRDALLAAIWPAAYAVYALARGSIDGWYAYWFFDPSKQSWGGIGLSVAGLSALVVGIAALLIAADRGRTFGPDR